jgi:hypothetical protein
VASDPLIFSAAAAVSVLHYMIQGRIHGKISSDPLDFSTATAVCNCCFDPAVHKTKEESMAKGQATLTFFQLQLLIITAVAIPQYRREVTY